MNITRSIIPAFLSSLSSLLFVSCIETIHLNEPIPAEVNMRRGATVAIRYKGDTARGVSRELIKLIKEDGYYNFVDARYTNPTYSIFVLRDEYSNIAPIICAIRSGCRGRILWKESGFSSTPERAAKQIYDIFAPHEVEYTIGVKTDEKKNPSLVRAVAMAKAGQWSQAKSFATESVKEHPEDPEAYYLLGALLRNDSHFDESDELFRKAMMIKPDDERFPEALKKNEKMRENESKVVNQLQGSD